MKTDKAKKSTKLLLVGIIVVVIGVVFGVIGMSLLKWNFLSLDTTVYEEQNFTFEQLNLDNNDPISSINIKVDSWAIDVVAGEEFSVKYYTTDEVTLEDTKIYYVPENNAINFIQEREVKITTILTMFKGMNEWKYHYVFTIPENVDVTINSGNSSVNIDGINMLNSDITCGNGSINIANVTAQNLKIKAENGSVSLKKSVLDEVTIDSGNGSFKSEDSNIRILNIKQGNGSTKLIKSSIDNLDVENYNGSFKTEDCSFVSVKVQCNNGSINMINTLSCDKYTILSKNGSVKVEIAGAKDDFALIEIISKNASIRVDDVKYDETTIITGSGDKTLNVESKNGSVRIYFI